MGTSRWPPLRHQHTCLCQRLTLTAQHGLHFPADGASGGALARLARRVGVEVYVLSRSGCRWPRGSVARASARAARWKPDP
jgi:hypothetical protein